MPIIQLKKESISGGAVTPLCGHGFKGAVWHLQQRPPDNRWSAWLRREGSPRAVCWELDLPPPLPSCALCLAPSHQKSVDVSVLLHQFCSWLSFFPFQNLERGGEDPPQDRGTEATLCPLCLAGIALSSPMDGNAARFLPRGTYRLSLLRVFIFGFQFLFPIYRSFLPFCWTVNFLFFFLSLVVWSFR